MVTINLNFNNFSGLPTLLEVFGSFDNNYEYTEEGIFRRKAPPFCPRCNSSMVHNSYNKYTKKGLGDIKIGRCKCSNCNCTPEENRSFWEGLKSLNFRRNRGQMRNAVSPSTLQYVDISSNVGKQ